MTRSESLSLISDVSVERIDNDSVEVRWKTECNDLEVLIYLGDSPNNIDEKTPAASVKGKHHVTVSGLAPKALTYFKLVPGDGRSVIAGERRVPFEGTMNFRDLGGYMPRKGRQVRWGRIYRSDNLNRLSDKDLNLLQQMGVMLACDFRTPKEVEKYPDRLPGDGSIEYLHLPIEHGEFDAAVAMDLIKKGDISWLTDEFMINRYVKNIDEFADIWGTVISRISESENLPLVFHCSAGKDRAGACAALILLCLDVPDETIIYDHCLSNLFLTDWLEMAYAHIESFGIEAKKVESYFTAPRDAMVFLLKYIRETYDSAENYLKVKAGISNRTIAQLKQELLE